MNGDIHARFWESAGVRFPRATHHTVRKLSRLNELEFCWVSAPYGLD